MLDILGAITGLFVLVYDGQHALKFTLGRAQEVVGPGVHWKWPILQKFKVEETKHTTLDLEPQTIQLADDLVYEIDCKVMYQIVDLRKAMIEIDDLVMGLRNRVVLAIQGVVRRRDRRTIRESASIVAEIKADLVALEEQWGVRILQLGFSNISPSPTTLEITQLELLAREKLALYGRLREAGLGDASSVALLSGAVVSLGADPVPATRTQAATLTRRVLDELQRDAEKREKDDDDDDEEKDKEEVPGQEGAKEEDKD
ncbi:MAG: SPFH domain-containing protein [Planctomycetota bacterium]|nr:SPFH domain-containing protein [Planctomycetota bacterium]